MSEKTGIQIRDYSDINRKLKAWTPQYQAWPLIYGGEVASWLTIANSFNMAYFIRKELRIRPHAKFTVYCPVMGFASLGAMVFQDTVINAGILDQTCPMCTTVKSVLGQITFGIFYPMLVAPLIGFVVADKLLSYPVPPLVGAFKDVLKLGLKLLQKNSRAIVGLGMVQIFGIVLITSQKQKTYLRMISSDKTPRT